MKELDIHSLRALIQLIPAVRALRDDVEKSIHLEFYNGVGDLAVSSFYGLRDKIARITEDEYIASLSVQVEETTKDRQKAAQVLIASGQLVAFLEGVTGVQISGTRSGMRGPAIPRVQVEVEDAIHGEVGRVMDIINGVIGSVPKAPKPPKPPKPPRAPRPPRPGRDFGMHFYSYEDDEDDDKPV